MDNLMETTSSKSITNLILLLDAADFQFLYLQDFVLYTRFNFFFFNENSVYLSLLVAIMCKQCRICR